MGKASSSKKVARVARTGGGRTKRGSTSWFWPVFIGVVVVLGTAGIVQAKMERQADASPPRIPGDGRPGDHWHAALGFYVCDTFLPNIADETDPLGIHTHNDGVVHIHPQRTAAAGRNARLGVFMDAVKGEVSESEIRVPGQETKKNGMKCGEKPARVQAKTWPSKDPNVEGTMFNGDPADIRFTDGQLITVAFVPDGTDIPRPVSAPNLDRLTDVPGATTTTAPGATPSTEPGATDTTAPSTETTPPPDAATTAPPSTGAPPASPPGTP
ncbi:MAG TPA: hypothetical protein VHF24_13740 [Acidimicrobiales bacterium]|nr:hypothetical protein [Acidimicrobiales bacterium]